MRNLVLTAAVIAKIQALRPGLSCYSDDEETLPRHCQPPFENIAFQKDIEASNTCGQERPESYCVQTGASGATQTCGVCDSKDPTTTHDSRLLTDFNNINKITWWQSQSMLDGEVQSPNSINLTLHLGKAFEITYVRLRFHSPRPESFAIYKKTCGDQNCPWIPYQYYSGSCDMTYPLDDGTQRKRFITHDDEQVALCTSDYSDISPLTGGSVAFSTLLARPSAYQFDKSPVLQEWVTAESIRISLDRINTFGDEIFHDPKVLQSYYYAISDLTIGGRCKCNGHASQCDLIDVSSNESNEVRKELQCKCEHNTMGRDCEMCKPLFNDRLWGRATGDSAVECQECDCNGLADSCYFDADELERTNGLHGGICVDCKENTAGNHCELCMPNFYKNSEGKCVACGCDSVGSVALQCDSEGICQCKPGVEGDKCDRCQSGYHSMDRHGCSTCGCDESGSILDDEGFATCDPKNGQCHCKAHVQGKTCNSCKDGFMNLQLDNEYGCYPCFCYSHIDSCEPSPTHYKANHESDFQYNKEHWTVEDEHGNLIDTILAPISSANNFDDNVLQVVGKSNAKQYFVLPDKFTGEQRFSYGQTFEFHYSILLGDNDDSADIDDVEIMPEPIQDTFSGDGVNDGVLNDVEEFIPAQAKKKVTSEISVDEPSDDICFYPSDAVLDFQRVICTE